MADIVNLNFKADGDFSGFIAEVNRAMATLSKFRNQRLSDPTLGLDKKDFDAAVNGFRNLVAQSGMYTSQIVNVTSSTEKFGRALSAQNLKLKDYYKAYVDFRKSSAGQIRMLAQEQVRIQSSVVKSLGRDMSGAQKAMVITPTGIDALANSAKIAAQETMIFNKVLRDGATSLINWGKNTQWAGRQLTVGLTLPIMLFGKTASEAFRRADEQLVRLAKVYGGLGATSSQELEMVRKNVSELAKTLASTYGASFEETLGLAADIAATGAEGNDLLAATAETTRLATLGEIDRQSAMQATLSLQTAFKMNTEELTESINFLNAVENQTSTTLNDLVEAIPKAGPVIRGMGGDVKDLALFMTAMREGGINASEGANALKSALAKLINPTKVTREMVAGFGIDLNSIVESNAGDVVGLIMSLKSALDELDPLSRQRAIEQIFGTFQYSRLSALLNNLGAEGSQTLQVLDLMKASTEDLAMTADKELRMLTESASGRYKRALETFKATLAEFGEPFLDIFSNILEVGSKIITVFDRMPRPLKAFLTGMAGVTAIIGPLIMLTGVMGNFLGYIIKGIASLRQLRSGAGAFELITTSTVAASQVADSYTKSTYNQVQAVDILRSALEKLEMAYYNVGRAAGGGAPPPGGMPGGPMGPVGPMVPMGPGLSGGAVPTAGYTGKFRELYTGLMPQAESARARLATELAGLTGADLEKALDARLLEAQQFYQQRKVGPGRGSAAIAPAMAAVLASRGMLTEGGQVQGMYKGIDQFPFYGSQYMHLFPEEKAKYSKSQAATGIIPGPGTLNELLGNKPGQTKLVTPEGKMAAIETRYMIEELLASGMNPTAMVKSAAQGGTFGAYYKEASREFFGKTPVDPDMIDAILSGTATETSVPAPSVGGAASPNIKVQRTKSGQLQVRGAGGKLISQSTQEAQLAIQQFTAAEDAISNINVDTKQTSRNIRQSAASAMRFAGVLGGAVGSVGMIAQMMLASSGSTNEAAMRAAQLATNIGFAIPAIQGLGAGLKAMGGSLATSSGVVGRIGQGLLKLGGPWGMAAIAGIAAITFAFKKMDQARKDAIAKAKADISVSEEALKNFGGSVLTAQNAFRNYLDTSAALAKKYIEQQQVVGIPGLPTPEEIEKVKEQVKDLFGDQIKRAKDLQTKDQAMEFARNLKSTLVAQGVDEKAASTVIASIFEQAGKKQFSIPVLLDIAGITDKEIAMQNLKDAAAKTFNEISQKLSSGGIIERGLAERFSEQLDLLSAGAISQIKDFEDLANVIDYLPEGMAELSFEQLNATYSGRQLLQAIKDTNPELLEALTKAGSLEDAIQMAAANAMGLSSALSGVNAQFDIAGQQAMKTLANTELNKIGINKYYQSLIAGEQKAIAAANKRKQAELDAADARREAIENQIDAERKIIDGIKEEADARRDALRSQQKSLEFERSIQQLRQQQKIAMMVGNFAEAAMIGLDIEAKTQDRSVELAEDAIDQKEKKEIKLHEMKIDLLEEEKKKIKDLTKEQEKAIEDRYRKIIDAHNKTIAKYREEATESANRFKDLFEKATAGSESAYMELQGFLTKFGGDLTSFEGTFSAFLDKTVGKFGELFGKNVASLLGPDYRVEDGNIQKRTMVPGPKGRGSRSLWETVSSIAELFGVPITGGPNGQFTTPSSGLDIGKINRQTGVIYSPTPVGPSFAFKAADGRTAIMTSSSNRVEASAQPYITDGTFLGYVTQDEIRKIRSQNRYMGGSVKKNYMIKRQRYMGGSVKMMGNGGALSGAFPYIVGEKGPELFIPNMNGNVVPADRLMSAVRNLNNSGVSSESIYNINVNVANAGASADQIADAIESKMRLMNQRVGQNRTVKI